MQRSIVRFYLYLINIISRMSYYVKIIFGKDQIRKHHNNEALTDYERIINLKKYTFETRAQYH